MLQNKEVVQIYRELSAELFGSAYSKWSVQFWVKKFKEVKIDASESWIGHHNLIKDHNKRVVRVQFLPSKRRLDCD